MRGSCVFYSVAGVSVEQIEIEKQREIEEKREREKNKTKLQFRIIIYTFCVNGFML